jgi:hypothetical protein
VFITQTTSVRATASPINANGIAIFMGSQDDILGPTSFQIIVDD